MTWSYAIWGLWAALFLVLEMTAVLGLGVPWRSLSETVWSLEDINRWLRVLALLSLIILTTHIVIRWP